jgi:hypothetical protein
MITTTIHSDRWFANVRMRAERFKLNIGSVMKEEALRYAMQMVSLTPPTNPTRATGADGKKLSNEVV